MTTSFWPLIKFVPAQTHFKFTRLAPFAVPVSTTRSGLSARTSA